MLVAVVLTLGSVASASAVAPDNDRDGLSNAFEIQYGLNPNARDSDGDGIRDGAQDLDGDGIPDGADDSNANGIPDGQEQDSGPVPANLKPSLQDARQDRPLGYTDGCHSTLYDPQIHPCVYGPMNTSRTIVMFGDSHGQQWMPALISAAMAHHWRVISITKSACPAVHVKFRDPSYPGTETSCDTWRLRGEAWLRAHPPNVIIISNTRGYHLIDRYGKVLTGSAFEARWRKGLARTLSHLPTSPAVVVLGDTPHMRNDIPLCLQAHPDDVSACQTSRAEAWRKPHDQAEAVAAAQHGATFVSLNATVCSYDPCPIVVNELLMWRDPNHLTATYVTELAPAIAPIVLHALASTAAGATDAEVQPPTFPGGP